LDSASYSRARVRLAALALGAACAGAGPARARVLVTQDQALAEAFPAGALERRTAFLTDEQAKAFTALAGDPPAARVVTYYVAPGGSVAWFDTHLVRTLPETVMVVIDDAKRVRRVDVLSFEEPIEYLPRPKWFEQFQGKALDKDLAPGRGIPAVTGATLTSRAVTEASRRCLALHAVICGGGGCAVKAAAAPAPAPPAPPPASRPD
jgi:hypothetical protein